MGRPRPTYDSLAHHGEYGRTLYAVCKSCGHCRAARAGVFAKWAGWSALLGEVSARLRCSKCGKKNSVLQATRPRGDEE